jgi:outer membrane protein TolC
MQCSSCRPPRFSSTALLQLFALLLFANLAHAEPQVLNLNKAVDEGMIHSPVVQKAKAAAEEADWHRVENLSGFLPTLTAQGQHLFNVKYQVLDVSLNGAPTVPFPQVIPGSSGTLTATLPLFDGFANIENYQAARQMAHAAQHDFEWTSFRVSQDIRLKYLQALAAEKLAIVSEQNIKTLEDHLSKTKALRRSGVSTQFDILRVEVQLSDANAENIQSQDNVVLARRNLAEALGADSEARSLGGDLPVPRMGLVEKIGLPEISARPDLTAVAERERAASEISSAASTYWIPRVSLFGQYIYYNNRDNSLTGNDQYRDAYETGINLTWNLFDGMSSIAKAREAVYREEQAERTTRMAQLHVPTDLELWKRRYNYSTVLYQSKITAVEKAQESVRLAQEGYRAGVRTSSEVLDAELDLFRARAGVVSSQMGASEALINLELAVGRKIANE